MVKKVIWASVLLTMFGFLSATPARADEWDKKSILTFSQPFEVGGQVFPAGTYTFKLADSMQDRHIVQIFNADMTKILATVMTIPDYRLKVTNETVIRFREVPRGQPEVIRAWFYPGNSIGQEFVYPKSRALELARTEKVFVPAVEEVNVELYRTATIVAITPDETEVPLATAFQPVAFQDSSAISQTARNTLPRTATSLPLIIMLGFASIGLAVGLMVFGKQASAPLA